MEKVSYSNHAFGLSLLFPSDWSLIENYNGHPMTAFFAPDGFSNIIFNMTKGGSIEDGDVLSLGVENFLADFPNNVENFELLARQEGQLTDVRALRIIYTFMYEGSMKKQMQVFMIKQTGLGYIQAIVTYTATLEKYDEYINAVEEMIGSIQIS
jgi:hypothetical protein